MMHGPIYIGKKTHFKLWSVALTSHPYVAPKLKKEYSYTSTTALGLHGLLLDEILNFKFFYNLVSEEHLFRNYTEHNPFAL